MFGLPCWCKGYQLVSETQIHYKSPRELGRLRWPLRRWQGERAGLRNAKQLVRGMNSNLTFPPKGKMLIYVGHFTQVILLKGESLLEIPGIWISAWISLRLRNESLFVGSWVDKSLIWSLSWILLSFCLLLPRGRASFQELTAQVGVKKKGIQVLRGTQKSACGFTYSLWCFDRSWAVLKTCNWLWALSPLEKSCP